MDSAVTRDPSLDALRRYDDLRVPGVPLDFLQAVSPRSGPMICSRCSAGRPELEWCPPGHGDIYTALAASGTLDALLSAGLRYAFVSNSDNLGALADVRIAAWVAAEQVPFTLEAVRGTLADRKGGHLAATRAGWCCGRRRRCPTVTRRLPTSSAGAGTTPTTSGSTCAPWRTCRTPPRGAGSAPDRQPQDRRPAGRGEHAGDPARDGDGRGGRLDPRRPGGPCSRSRFVPVKTTDDLLVVRSDAYELASDGQMRPAFDGPGPSSRWMSSITNCCPTSSSGFLPGAVVAPLPPVGGRRRRHLRCGGRGRGRRAGRRSAPRSGRGSAQRLRVSRLAVVALASLCLSASRRRRPEPAAPVSQVAPR